MDEERVIELEQAITRNQEKAAKVWAYYSEYSTIIAEARTYAQLSPRWSTVKEATYRTLNKRHKDDTINHEQRAPGLSKGRVLHDLDNLSARAAAAINTSAIFSVLEGKRSVTTNALSFLRAEAGRN